MNILFPLAIFGLLFPPMAEYLCAFLILVWLVRTHQKFAGAEAGWSWDSLPMAAREVLRWTAWGTLAFWGTALLSSVLASFSAGNPVPLQAAALPFAHLFVKRCLLWWVLGVGVVVAYQRGWRLQRMILPLTVMLAVYFVYGLVQRYTGIDLVHGMGAVLGQHRFGYGVYRVSGFMGHPIPLSYNLMLLLLTVAALVRRHGSRARAWIVVFALSAALLLVSGSRWPLVVIAATVLFCEGRALWKTARWVAVGAVVAGGALWAEGSLIQRGAEIFRSDGSLYDRVPRLLFWKTHWDMFLDHPLVGVGYVGYDTVAAGYYERSGFGDFREKYTAHNLVLQTLADSGLLGMAGLVALFVAFVLAARGLSRAGKPQALSYLIWATVLGALMQNLLRDTTYLYGVWLCAAVLLAEATVPARDEVLG